MSSPPSASKVRWISLALALVTFLVFSRVLTCDFTVYDDEGYVTKNEVIKQGLTWNGIKYAATKIVGGNWHPITMLSHMVDCQMFGLKPWGHHLTNLLLHCANSILVLLLFYRATGALWSSAILAAIFALHPLRVESVAWIAERKDLLSAFFGLLCLLSYVRYARELEGKGSKAKAWYGVALLLFLLGLMSKPMLVTWPFVMMLFDLWPLKRLPTARDVNLAPEAAKLALTIRRLALEKIPLLLISLVFCWVTVHTQYAEAWDVNRDIHLPARIANAGVAYTQYLLKTLWPMDLAVLYPHPGHWPPDEVIVAFAVIIALTIAILIAWRGRSWLAVGWLWFLGTLVPVIGILQVGAQFMADRYSYLPHIGLFIAVVWLAAELFHRFVFPRAVIAGITLAILAGFGTMTWTQTAYWRTSETLFARALAVTSNNSIAHLNYALAAGSLGRTNEMLDHYVEAIRLNPDFHIARLSLGLYLYNIGDYQGTTNHLAHALAATTNYPLGNYFLAKAQVELSEFEQAERNFALATANTNGAPVHSDWAKALVRENKFELAIQHFEMALKSEEPGADIHAHFAAALAQLGRFSEAVSHYREAIRLKPDFAELYNNLAWILATCRDNQVRDGKEAIRLARRACELAGENEPVVYGTLAAALAEAGEFEEAKKVAAQAISLAERKGLTQVAEKNRELLKLYEIDQPFHESPAETK
jgi:tetratricopeptide (TPR) repeat protein